MILIITYGYRLNQTIKKSEIEFSRVITKPDSRHRHFFLAYTAKNLRLPPVGNNRKIDWNRQQNRRDGFLLLAGAMLQG